MRDHRLSDSARSRVAWALLARTHRGDAYEVDPAALDWMGGGNAATGIGERHLALIDSVISGSRDPGEGAVRLAYTIVAAEGLVSDRARTVAAAAAALLRDRALARRDTRTLVREARAEGVSPLVLNLRWRAEHRFVVEEPALAQGPRRAAPATLVAAGTLVERLLGIVQPVSVQQFPPAGGSERPPLLSWGAAQRLADLAADNAVPP